MCDSLIDYARVVQPLQKCLDVVLSGKRKTRRAASWISVTLNEEGVNSFNEVKTLLQQSAQLAYPTLCLVTDASDEGWASILTQVAVWEPGVAVDAQAHELLIGKGGTFSWSSKTLSMFENEGYPIVISCEDLDYILLLPGGLKEFCDHRNLIHVFAPGQEIKKHARALKKLQSDANITLLDVRDIFDALIERYPSVVESVGAEAPIVKSMAFENACVQVHLGKEVVREQHSLLKDFAMPVSGSSDSVDEDGDRVGFADRALRACK
ncbi:hypothetical protein PR001_g2294 [Phytophthora rubi]|uniref:Uncharacterized protein n=1 Tax=Phytophthora rubi TaxID=129364 RepID=A0A6A3P994_9STRA|nr:hypothetical protein PR001_g2294 [Phytophthora rubi]